MWCNWVAAQLVPLVLVKMFMIDLHQDGIPRIYGEWTFPLQVVSLVCAVVTSFTFYATSWMPAGRVLEEDNLGKEDPSAWQQCQECNFPTPVIARHCSLCKICVWEREHHCFVTGNCLGRDNVQAFNLLYILCSTSGLLYLTVVMGAAWWRHVALVPREWLQGALSFYFLVRYSQVYLRVKRRRRRWKQRYPLFFAKEGEQADNWP